MELGNVDAPEMEVEQYLVPESAELSPRNVFKYCPIKDVSGDRYVSMMMEVYWSGSREEQYYLFSITGGYCRNHMLKVQTITDVDIVTLDSNAVGQLMSKHFPESGDNEVINTFQIPGNTLHLLPYGYPCISRGIDHVFIHPRRFDFTVNLACMSAVDGWLYAPPVTMFDMKNRILRPCNTLFDESNLSTSMLLSIILRGIRFSLKYDMRIHESLLRAMDVLFALQNYTGQVDDTTLFHTLKHVNQESEDLKNRYYSVLQALHFIDTDKYTNFADFFQYVTANVEGDPRMSPVDIVPLMNRYNEE